MVLWKKAFALTLVPLAGYACAGTWSGVTSGNWNVATNWSPNTCIPGSVVTNTDTATFGSVVGNGPMISLDGVPIDPGLGQLIFANPLATFTINSTTHFLQFNGANSSIEVLAGSHILNAPVHLSNTTLSITGMLTLQKAVTGTSINFNGLGQLLNEKNSVTLNGSFSIFSGTVINMNTAAVVAGTGSLIQTEQNFLLNNGNYTNSNSGPVTGSSSVGSSTISLNNLTINDGTTTVTNTGAVDNGNGCFFGAVSGTINGGSVTFQNTGLVTNAGVGNFISFHDLTINGGSIVNSNTGPVSMNVSTGSFISVEFNLIMNGGTLTNTNSGILSSQGIGSLIEAETALTINGGALVNNDTVWTPLLNIGNAGTVAGSGLFQNISRAPTIQVVNAGTVIPGGPALGENPGVMTIQGSYDQSGTLGINLLNASSFSQLQVTGTAHLAGNLAVAFSPGATVLPGETFPIVQSSSISGIFSKLINFNIPNLTPHVQYFPTSVLLSFTPSTSHYPNYVETLFASNNQIYIRLERQMAQLRDRFAPKKTVSRPKYIATEQPFLVSDYKNPFSYLRATQQDKNGPKMKTDFCHQTLAYNEQQLAFFRYQGVEEKQEQLRRVISTCEPQPWNFYLGPTGDVGKVLTKKQGAGFNYGSAGALAGFDYAFSKVGLGLLLNYDHLQGIYRGGKFNINHAHGNFYATYAPTPQWAVNAILGGGYDQIEIRRHAGIKTTPAIAKGSPQGGEFDALLGLEYVFDRRKFCAMPQKLQVIPLVSLQYNYFHAGKYREHGAEPFNLKFSGQTAESLRSTIGARLNYSWEWRDVMLTPELNMGWQREFLDHGRFIHFSPVHFIGASRLKMPRSGRNVALAGVDFLVTLYDKYGIEASYDFEWNSLYHDQFFYLGCNFRF